MRLARVTALVLQGLAIVALRFAKLDPAGRHAEIAQWSRRMLSALGVALRSEGERPIDAGLVVANHVSWLDIMAIHATAPQVRFVSKADVRDWPLVGRLVTAAGTIYLERERSRDALRVVHHVAEAIGEQRQLVGLFPEGTTGDGHALLPFHANLLQAAVTTGRPVQPIALRYSDAEGPVSVAAQFVGETTLAQSLWRIACARGMTVRVQWLAPEDPADHGRRELAARLRERIGAALNEAPIRAKAPIGVRSGS